MTDRKKKEGNSVTAKEYLGQYLEIDRLINSKKRTLQKLRLQSVSLSAAGQGTKVKGTSGDRIRILDRIMDMESEITTQELRLIEKQREILNKIQLVCNSNLIAVLTDKYINGLSFEKIAELNDKSVRTICVWHGQALQIFRRETGMS